VGECGINTLTPILTEGTEVFSPGGQTSWVVFDKETLNGDGRSVGYEIVPKIGGLWRGMITSTEAWTNGELWVTAYDDCERYAASNHTPQLAASCGIPARNVSDMVNGDSVDGEDLVVWYAQRFQHIPRDEDETTMPIEWTSFEIQPRSFYFQNPAP
jgi:primary-amine oxidase